jgi:uncharacterized protein (TIGR02284 family)
MAQVRNDEVVDLLNNLIETCKDGEYGFNESADNTRSPELRTLFRNRAMGCAEGATELQRLVVQYGGTADTGGSVSGAVHRGWVSVRSALSTYTDQAMLEEVERGEDAALKRYRDAMQHDLPNDVREVIAHQLEGVQRNHDQVKALRDSHRTAAAS